jgi:hypothetical protein
MPLSLNDFAKQELGYGPGSTLSAAEADNVRRAHRMYMDKIGKAAADRAAGEKPAFTPGATEVALPDGRKVQMIGTSPNSAMVAPAEAAPKFERITAADGTVKLIDTMTGKSITAWDEQTGSPVKAPVRSGEDAAKGQQVDMLASDIAKLQSGSGFYWTQAGRQADIAAKQAQLNAMLNPASVLAGAPSPSAQPPAPTPQASPTPDSAFLTSPMPPPTPEATPAPTPLSMSSSDYQSKYGRAMKPGRYRTKSGAEVLITD